MADRWIITSFDFAEHRTQASAEAEAARLRAKVPEKIFRVVRVKTTLMRSNAETVIGRLQQALASVIVAYRAGTLSSRSTAISGAELALAETNYFWPNAERPGDRTGADTTAISPEPSLSSL